VLGELVRILLAYRNDSLDGFGRIAEGRRLHAQCSNQARIRAEHRHVDCDRAVDQLRTAHRIPRIADPFAVGAVALLGPIRRKCPQNVAR